LNQLVARAFRKNPDGKAAFFTRSYVSTFVGQFLDNLVFSLIVFVGFAPIFWDGFSWTPLQCVTCALTGAIAELILEALFSPIAFRIVKRWKSEGVGQRYLTLVGDNK
ncbi:MAG: VUT family protein, partial [Clostridia bacterium]|nr:VUT family protein [Clostridia bacterium]